MSWWAARRSQRWRQQLAALGASHLLQRGHHAAASGALHHKGRLAGSARRGLDGRQVAGRLHQACGREGRGKAKQSQPSGSRRQAVAVTSRAPLPKPSPPRQPAKHLTRHGVAVLEHAVRQREQHVQQALGGGGGERRRRRRGCHSCGDLQAALLLAKLLLERGAAGAHRLLHLGHVAGGHLRGAKKRSEGWAVRDSARLQQAVCPARPANISSASTHSPPAGRSTPSRSRCACRRPPVRRGGSRGWP